MSRHYLDHASTSPLRPEVASVFTDALASRFGDPSRIHTEGLEARHAVEVAREAVAGLVGARSREVVFTSGASESIAAAVWGTRHRGPHTVLTAVEHSAVREAASRGATTVVPVDGAGRVDPDEVLAAITEDTGLVHVQWGNHEVGTTQPLEAIAAGCRERDVLVHVDAAQAVGHVPVDFGALGADLLSFGAHKFGGPAGVGALLIRRGLRIEPLVVGGDQERARRAGTEAVAALVAFGVAAELLTGGRLADERDTASAQVERLRSGATTVPGVVAYGDPEHRLPHIACLGIDGVEPQAVLLGLDRKGIAAHSGSACSSESLEPSPVLEAMGVDAHRSLRLSVGWDTTDTDVDAVLEELPVVVGDLRALRG